MRNTVADHNNVDHILSPVMIYDNGRHYLEDEKRYTEFVEK